MEAKSRFSGDILEYYVCYVLSILGAKPADDFTRAKMLKFVDKINNGDDITIGKRVKLVKCLAKFFRNYTPVTYQLMSDTNGKTGDATDIRFISTKNNIETPINLSLKRNNHSVKAQRPSGLNKLLPADISKRYLIAYNQLTAQWYRRFINLLNYDQILDETKSLLYYEFNRLYAHTITKYQPVATLTNFLLSNNIDNKFMLEWNDRKNQLTVYDCAKITIPTTINAEVDPNRPSYVTLEFFDTDANPYLVLELRLHNAKKQITPKLSIKYDTKIVNIGDIYPRSVY